MKTAYTYKKNGKQISSQPSSLGIDYRAIAKELVAKSFPNGDPNFFKPSHSLTKDNVDVSNPYDNNVWVYACCTAISANLLQVPKVLDETTEEKGNDNEYIDEHAILELFEHPNSLMDGPTFWENVVLDLMLPTSTTKGGQCFLLSESLSRKPVNLRKGEIPKELYPFSDDYVSPVIDKYNGNQLIGWKLTVGNEEILYKPEEVIRIYLVDPKHPLKGQAPIWAARSGLRNDKKAEVVNENFFNNNATLGGTLVTDAELDQHVADELREKFEAKYSGQDNAGRVALLHSGITYKEFERTHADMQFLEQRKFSREEVISAYRVPKFLVGLYEDINYATAREAMKAFWNNVLIPIDNRILTSMNNQWIQHVEEGMVDLESDYSKVEALQPDFTEKLKQADLLFKMHVPMAEVNRRLELNLNIDDYPWLQTSLVPFGQVPAEQVMSAPPPEDVDTSDDDTDIPSDEESETSDDEVNSEEQEVQTVLLKFKELNKQSALETMHDNYVNSVLLPQEKTLQKKLGTYFTQQRNAILDKIDAWANKHKAVKGYVVKVSPPSPEGFTNNIAAETKRLRKLMKPIYEDMALAEMGIVEAELGAIISWSMNSPSMKTGLKKRLRIIGSINTTTFKFARNNIGDAISVAVEQGLGVNETAKLLKKAVNKTYTGRINSKTIARTEVSSIHSDTRRDIYKREGVKKIQWLTSSDELVRKGKDVEYPHAMLHQKVTDIDTPFFNGENIKYPLDPSASPSNVINCRCIIVSKRSE